MSEPVTASSLRTDIQNAGHSLKDAVETYRQHAANYPRVKHDFQVAWDRAFLAAEGTEQTKKSKANLLTEELSLAHDQALEQKRLAKAEMEAWQSIVSSYQSISATAREEMKLSR